MNKEELFKKRIGFKGELGEIAIAVSKEYKLGQALESKLILIGYEDFNFFLKTIRGKYFVKVFGDFRKLAECKRHTRVMEEAVKQGVQTPKLFKSKQGSLNVINVKGKKLRLVVMEYIDGKTLYELKAKLTKKEIKLLAREAAKISRMKIKPTFVYDLFAIVNLLKEVKKAKRYLSAKDLQLVQPVISEFKKIKFKKLPHCFIHADIINTNVMKDKKGKLWIIDFAVGNYYPRINELAVMACSPLFEPKNKMKTKKNIELALKEYQKTVRLTKNEIQVFPAYIKFAHAMHVIAATYEKYKKGNKTKENEYWLNLGRKGLRMYANE